MQNYKIDILTYQQDGSVRSDCADIAFQNLGAVPIVLNNAFKIPVNGFLSFTANNYEVDNTIYTFYFEGSTGVQQNSLVVVRKIYI